MSLFRTILNGKGIGQTFTYILQNLLSTFEHILVSVRGNKFKIICEKWLNDFIWSSDMVSYLKGKR
jgi:hypothetical protein